MAFIEALRLRKRVFPSKVSLLVTSKCNLHCAHCSIGANGGEDLPLNDILMVLGQLKEWLGEFSLGVSGGEPLLRKDLMDILVASNQLSLQPRLFTNGILLDKNWTMAIVSKHLVSGLFVSLHGGSGGLYSDLRGKDCFDQVAKNLQDFQIENSSGRISLMVGVLLTRNCNLKSILDLSKKIGAKVAIQALRCNFGSRYEHGWFKKSPLWPSRSELSGAYRLIRRGLAEGVVANTPSHLKHIRKYYEDPDMIYCKVGCNSYYSHLAIEANGDLHPCCSFPIGNVKQHSPKQIWYSELGKDARQKLRSCTLPCRIASTERARSAMEVVFDKLRSRSI